VVQHVRVLSSVHSGVIEDLVAAIALIGGVRVSLGSGTDATRWLAARSAGSLRSGLARLWGFAYPLRARLHDDAGTADVIVATTNPFWLPAAVALRAPRRTLITLVYDVYPDSLTTRLRLPGLFTAVVDAIVRFGLRRSSTVVALGPRMRDALVARHDLRMPSAVIATGDDPARFAAPGTPDPALAARLEGRVVIAYIGNAGSVHDVSTLAHAIRSVVEERPDRVAVVVSARGDRRAELLAPLADLEAVEVLSALDDATWRWVTARTDIACVGLGASSAIVSLPSRCYAALAAGSAILAVAPEASDLAGLVRTSGAGSVTPPGDVGAATTALLALVDDDALREGHASAARAAAENFTPERLAENWTRLLSAALSHARTPR
jgi:glycosyltransferase involved in cell wall biosynthesis